MSALLVVLKSQPSHGSSAMASKGISDERRSENSRGALGCWMMASNKCSDMIFLMNNVDLDNFFEFTCLLLSLKKLGPY